MLYKVFFSFLDIASSEVLLSDAVRVSFKSQTIGTEVRNRYIIYSSCAALRSLSLFLKLSSFELHVIRLYYLEPQLIITPGLCPIMSFILIRTNFTTKSLSSPQD